MAPQLQEKWKLAKQLGASRLSALSVHWMEYAELLDGDDHGVTIVVRAQDTMPDEVEKEIIQFLQGHFESPVSIAYEGVPSE